ncbi:hypothetical protein EX30DRAFT_68159 [Ascodesmis nigricans]|uniref:Uncharacterized protein n=1 Tax=Ascodesmis nigricans TaxID=341454 RepID=A0A4S2MU70_9PEZI|nr:hypothetical protein EX30DRAFT_68159 [Ascodesmis nigricans]
MAAYPNVSQVDIDNEYITIKREDPPYEYLFSDWVFPSKLIDPLPNTHDEDDEDYKACVKASAMLHDAGVFVKDDKLDDVEAQNASPQYRQGHRYSSSYPGAPGPHIAFGLNTPNAHHPGSPATLSPSPLYVADTMETDTTPQAITQNSGCGMYCSGFPGCSQHTFAHSDQEHSLPMMVDLSHQPISPTQPGFISKDALSKLRRPPSHRAIDDNSGADSTLATGVQPSRCPFGNTHGAQSLNFKFPTASTSFKPTSEDLHGFQCESSSSILQQPRIGFSSHRSSSSAPPPLMVGRFPTSPAQPRRNSVRGYRQDGNNIDDPPLSASPHVESMRRRRTNESSTPVQMPPIPATPSTATVPITPSSAYTAQSTPSTPSVHAGEKGLEKRGGTFYRTSKCGYLHPVVPPGLKFNLTCTYPVPENVNGICGKEYQKAHEMRKHLDEYHMNFDLWQCSNCKRVFGRQSTRTRHRDKTKEPADQHLPSPFGLTKDGPLTSPKTNLECPNPFALPDDHFHMREKMETLLRNVRTNQDDVIAAVNKIVWLNKHGGLSPRKKRPAKKKDAKVKAESVSGEDTAGEGGGGRMDLVMLGGEGDEMDWEASPVDIGIDIGGEPTTTTSDANNLPMTTASAPHSILDMHFITPSAFTSASTLTQHSATPPNLSPPPHGMFPPMNPEEYHPGFMLADTGAMMPRARYPDFGGGVQQFGGQDVVRRQSIGMARVMRGRAGSGQGLGR